MGFSDLFSETETSVKSADPEFRERGLKLFGTGDVTDTLTSRLNTSYSPYGDDRYASLNPDQLSANQMLRGNVLNIPGQNIWDRSVAAAGSLPSNRVDPVTGEIVGQQAFGGLQKLGRDRIQDIIAGQFAGTNLAPYTNPYEDQVVQAAMQDIDRARQMAIQQNDSRATLAGAYGGDRAALVNAETNRAAIDRSAQVAADLRSRGFDKAADLYEDDANRTMKADESNQYADLITARDAMNIGADISQQNQQEKRLARTDEAMNQLRSSQALLDAFGQGSDIYRSYLSDFVGVGDRLDDRSQRQYDFDFDEFMRGTDYDQSMIDNMIRLFGVAPRTETTEKSTDRGLMGDFSSAVGMIPGIDAAAGAIRGWGDDDSWWS